MNHLSATLCMALVAVLATFAQAMDLYHLCGQFDHELRKAVGESTDSETNFNMAMKLLAKEHPLNSRIRTTLAKAWKAVHDSNECDASVDALVSQLYECRPQEHERLRVTLGAAITYYVTKCSSTNGHWNDRVCAVESKIRSNSQPNIEISISPSFINLYSMENNQASEQSKHPRDLARIGCCQPKKAGKPAFLNLLDVYEDKYGSKSGREYFNKKPKAIGNYVNKWIVGPCIKYADALGPVMSEVDAAAQFYPGGYDAFINNQGNLFKDALFRFNFCKKLPEQTDELVEAIKVAQKTN